MKWHCSGWTANGSGGEHSYPGIDVGVLVSSEEVMAAHYANYPDCTRFKRYRVNHVELLEQLLNDRLADGREASGVADLLRSVDTSSSSPEPAVAKKLAKMKNSRKNLRKQAMENLSEDAGLEKLAMAIAGSSQSKMALAMQRVEKLEIFRGNVEAQGCLYDVFYADEKKADYFLNLPTHMMAWWIKKEFNGQILLDPAWQKRENARLERAYNENQIGVTAARKRARKEFESEEDEEPGDDESELINIEDDEDEAFEDEVVGDSERY